MLRITIPAVEMWDEEKEEFVTGKECTLTLEHSLLSISKWESKWKKAFLGKQDKTLEETLDYVRCMTLTQNINPDVYKTLSNENVNEIMEYINDTMTATHFHDNGESSFNRETITSELIYHWMITWEIPFECEKWHLNRLLTLIRVRAIKSQPAKKMSRNEILSRNAALNAERRKQMQTKG